ncbi:MAG: hypothetical protein IJB93_00065 [Clostridia bacterium]|nr:hypothetical protein [Clostridia bacterium]
MANGEIFVPIMPWLIGGSRIGGSYNIYNSSVGTDPYKGCLSEKIMNYRIWIEKIEEDEYLKACCYFGLNSYDNQPEDEIITQTFPLTEEGREQVRAFIENQKAQYFNDNA